MSLLLKLKNLYKNQNKDCVILTCGPSLTEYSKQKIKNFCKDKFVICIKEAVELYEDICNIHIVNEWRIKPYNLTNKNIIRIIQSYSGKYSKKYHISLPEDRPFFAYNQLLKTKHYSKYLLDKNIKRPWGPGILYETVFYLTLYMGFTNCYTIGWDLISPKSQYVTHYFDKNKPIYKNQQFYDELLFVNNNIPSLYNFFKEHELNIIVCGKQSYVNKVIPRILLD